MKRIVCLLLALMMIIGMTACGGNTDVGNGGNNVSDQNGGSSDDYNGNSAVGGELFVWSKYDEGQIEGLTEWGKQQKTLEIPANCVLVYGIQDNDVLETVTFASDDTKVHKNAFNGCTALKQITLPANLTEIDRATFSGCTSLEQITIPDTVTTIEMDAFLNCSSLQSVKLPQSLTTIGYCAFKTTGLLSVEFPAGLEIIEEGAFEQCAALKSVKFTGGCETLEDRAFSQCSALEKVVLPDGMKILGAHCLSLCDSLKELHIPASVEEVDFNALMQTHTIDVYLVEGSYIDQCIMTLAEAEYYNVIYQ